MDKLLKTSIEKLGNDFEKLNWNFEIDPTGRTHELISNWLGEPDEEIIVCAFKGNSINEPFHRQDFFFLNFAYQNDYMALSKTRDNHITIQEGDCYIGQPFSGYAIKGDSENDIIIIGVLIRKDVFFKEFLSTLASDNAMFHFFLDTELDSHSDAVIHVPLDKKSPVWSILNTMIIEYAHKKEDTPKILKPLTLAICMLVSRELKKMDASNDSDTLISQILAYIHMHPDVTKLSEIACHFGYHPNYISSFIHKETGKTFSQLLLDARMEKAGLLLKGTTLSIEEIALMLGYTSTSNFYKAFRNYYHATPRSFLQ